MEGGRRRDGVRSEGGKVRSRGGEREGQRVGEERKDQGVGEEERRKGKA